MSLWERVSDWIASTGTNPTFIAFNAHAGFAFTVTTVCWVLGAPLVPTMLSLYTVAAIKEFWFDARYEVPHQSAQDNIDDYVGYVVGAAFAGVLLHLTGHWA